MMTNSPTNQGRLPWSEPFQSQEESSSAQLGSNESTPDSNPHQEESFYQRFLDVRLSLEERLEAWIHLQKKNPQQRKSLVQIAISPNPYEGQDKAPHSEVERDFKREESFRIMALQGLEKAALENPAYLSLLEKVAQQAASPTVRSLAEKMKAFVKEGRSYSELFEKAAMSQEIPQ